MKLTDILFEEQNNVNAATQAIGAELKDLANGIDHAFQDVAKKENEAVMTTVSLVLALPAVLGLIAKVGRAASKIVSKFIGTKPNDAEAAQRYFQQIGQVADQLHHLYIKPIEFVVKKFVKDEKKAKFIASAIFHVIVAILCISSGVEAIKALQSKEISIASLESALTAVKGGEVKTYLEKLFA